VLNESACNCLARRLLFSVCAEMVFSRADEAESAAFRGLDASVCLPFFDNCIFDGRDTLAAPLCFLQLRVLYVRVWGTVWAPCLMMDGVGYELCAD
jgi:hypothetical protein